MTQDQRSDSPHKLFVLVVDWRNWRVCIWAKSERALFLISEVSINPRAQGASCRGDTKHARPLCRLGCSSCTMHGGDSWREPLASKLASATCNTSHLQYAVRYWSEIRFSFEAGPLFLFSRAFNHMSGSSRDGISLAVLSHELQATSCQSGSQTVSHI